MIDHDPDFWPTMEEAEEMSKDSQEYWKELRKERAELYTVWQDYEDLLLMCDKCKKVFTGDEATIEHESNLICALHCPKCKYKLLILQTEASHEELQTLASLGHKKAISAIETRESSSEA